MPTDTASISSSISRLVAAIFPAPDYDDISLTDPRFRWVVKWLYTGREDIATLRDLVDAAVGDMDLDNAELQEALTHLRDFLQEQVNQVLEDELFSIVAPLSKGNGRLPTLLDRFGWTGNPQTTLQEAADTLGITRERVRQIQARIERQLLSQPVWTPVLHRAVRIVRNELPISERDMGIRLHRAGIAKTETFSAEGLLKAVELFEPTVSLGLATRHGSTWIVDPTADDQMLLITDVQTVVQKAVSNQGIVSFDVGYGTFRETCDDESMRDCTPDRFRRIVEELEGYEIIDGSWIVHRSIDVRNPLVNRLNKILSVCTCVSVDWAVHLLRREYRDHRALDIDANALRAFVRHRPGYEIDDDMISVDVPEHPSDALSDSEQVLRQCILANGGRATFNDLETAGERAGLQKVTVAVTLRSSPIFLKPDYNTYRTIGAGSGTDLGVPSELMDTSGDDVIDAVIDQAELPDSDPILEESDSRDLALESVDHQGQWPPAAPIATPAGERIDEREIGRVRRLTKQLLKREGLVSIDAVTEHYGRQYRGLGRDVVLTVANGIADWVVIKDELITSLPRNGSNPLAAGLRKMLTWLPALPVDLAVRQFIRDTRTVTQITEDALEAYVEIDDEFGLADGVIVWDRPDLVSNVLSAEEKAIAQLLRDLEEPIGLGIVHSRLGLSRHQEPEFDELFLNSVLVEEIGRNRYRLLGAEYREAIARSKVAHAAATANGSESAQDEDTSAVSAVTGTTAGSDGSAREAADGEMPGITVEPEEIDIVDELITVSDERATTILPSQYGTTETTMITLQDLVQRARDGWLRLPEIQREYVWKSKQVLGLLDSLYRNYPIGNMLIWQTSDTPVSRQIGGSANGSHADGGSVAFLLDGQQRLTSMQRLLDHNEPDIRFNPFTEEFRAATATVKRNSQWIPVHTVLTRSVGAALRDHGLDRHGDVEELERRLERLKGILTVQIPVNRLHNFDYESVTDIFVRVNSQGTRLRTAELAVANLAFQLPGIVSQHLADLRDELAADGWDIDTMVLMRMLNAIVTGQSSFRRLASVHSSEIEAGWPRLVEGVHGALRLIRDQLRIESIDWLPTINALVVPVSYVAKTDEEDLDVRGLMDWFVRASTFGRYTGQTETRLNQDLRTIRGSDAPFPHLVSALRGTVGNFRVTLGDLQGATWQSPLSLLFWLTLRRAGAVDLWTGMPLGSTRLEGGRDLVQHHLFPRRAPGVSLLVSQVNELSNFAFLAQEPDLMLQNAVPANSLVDVPVDRLERQYIPTDPEMWKPSNARRFIEHRRRLLVRAMNETLQSLSNSIADEGRNESLR